MYYRLLAAIAGAAFAFTTGAFAADLPVKAMPSAMPLGASGYLELYGGWDRARFSTNSFDPFDNTTDDGWLIGGAGRVNLWISPGFSVQFDAQGEGTQFKVDQCPPSFPCNYTAHTYLVAGHATLRDPRLGGVGVFAAIGDMTVPSTGFSCEASPLSCNASVRFALGGLEAFYNWNQFTFYVQGGWGGTVGDNMSIFGWDVSGPFARGTVRYYFTPTWLLEGTVQGTSLTIAPFNGGGGSLGSFQFADQDVDVLLWRLKLEAMVHPNLSVYAAYQGSHTELSCNGSFCPSGLTLEGRDDRFMGGVRLWLNRDNLRNNDLTGAPLDIINPLTAAFVAGGSGSISALQ